MADTAAALVIQLSADVKAFKTEMERAVGINDKASRDILRRNKTLQTELSGGMKEAASQANAALESIGIGLSVAGFAEFVKKALDAATQLKDLHEQSGLTTETLQALQYAGIRAGVSFEQINAGALKFNQTLGDFLQNQSGPGAKAFEDLGIRARIMRGEFDRLHGTQEVFAATFKALAGVKDNATLAAYAAELFGRQLGPRLVPLIRETNGSLDDMIKKARDAGAVIGDDLNNALANVNAQFATLFLRMEKDGARALGALMPEIKEFAGDLETDVQAVEDITSQLDTWFNWLTTHVPGIQTALKAIGDAAYQAFNPLGTAWNTLKGLMGEKPTAIEPTSEGKTGSGMTGQLTLGPKDGGRSRKGPSAEELARREAALRKQLADQQFQRNQQLRSADEQADAARETSIKAQDQALLDMSKGTVAYFDLQKLVIEETERLDLAAIERRRKAAIDAIDDRMKKEIVDKPVGISAADEVKREADIRAKAAQEEADAVNVAQSEIRAATLRTQADLKAADEERTHVLQNQIDMLDTARDGIISLGEAGVHGFKSMQDAAVQLVEALAQMALKLFVLKPLVEGIFGPQGTAGGGLLGGLLSSISLGGGGVSPVEVTPMVSLGARASGGPVSAGHAYLVGEHRPELFVPNVSGMVMPSIPQVTARGAPTIHAPVQVVLHLDGAMDAETMRTYARTAAAVAGNEAVKTMRSNLLGWYNDQAARMQ